MAKVEGVGREKLRWHGGERVFMMQVMKGKRREKRVFGGKEGE